MYNPTKHKSSLSMGRLGIGKFTLIFSCLFYAGCVVTIHPPRIAPGDVVIVKDLGNRTCEYVGWVSNSFKPGQYPNNERTAALMALQEAAAHSGANTVKITGYRSNERGTKAEGESYSCTD